MEKYKGKKNIDRESVKITSLQQLADMALELTGSPVFLSDASGRILSFSETEGAKQAAKDSFFMRLLAGAQVSEELIAEQTELFGWKHKPYIYVLVICPSITNQWMAEPKEIAAELQEIPDLEALVFNQHVVCVYSVDAAPSHWEESQYPFTQILRKYNLIVAISQAIEKLTDLSKAYLQAREMAVIADVIKNGPIFYTYDEYAVYAMFEQADQSGTLRKYCHKKVLLLEEYDFAHNTDLVPTLHAYLENGRSIQRTAELMYIHRNTVSYRINKSFELLGTRVENENELFAFNFSLRILEYYNQKNGKPSPYWRR